VAGNEAVARFAGRRLSTSLEVIGSTTTRGDVMDTTAVEYARQATAHRQAAALRSAEQQRLVRELRSVRREASRAARHPERPRLTSFLSRYRIRVRWGAAPVR
jgi:hypothetical protein